jgi:hypothetical protein
MIPAIPAVRKLFDGSKIRKVERPDLDRSFAGQIDAGDDVRRRRMESKGSGERVVTPSPSSAILLALCVLPKFGVRTASRRRSKLIRSAD